MGILRADRITGLGGANAITGSTHFAGDANTGNYLRVDTGLTEDFTFGTGDFTIEFWVNSQGSGFQQHFYDGRGTTNSQRLLIYMDSNHTMYYFDGTATRIQSSSALPIGDWVHVALVRASATTKLYWNGTQTGSTHTSDTVDFLAPTHGSAFIGSNGGTDGIEPSGGGYFNGFLSNYRIVKGTAVYTENFTPPNTRLPAIDGTVLLTCTSSGNVSKTEGGNDVQPSAKNSNSTPPVASRFTPNSPVGFSTTTDVGTQFGATFDGVTTFDSQAYFVPPSGNTRERNRGRGVMSGGETPSRVNTIAFTHIQSSGTFQDFGDLIGGDAGETRGVGSSTRGVFFTNHGGSSGQAEDLEFITFANQSNGTDFGDLPTDHPMRGSAGNETRGIFAGGYKSSLKNEIEFITIATTGNGTDFGNLSGTRNAPAGLASLTRALFGGGGSPSNINNIDIVTIATTGDASDFGDLTRTGKEMGGVASNTRGVFAGARINPSTASNVIDFVTIASAGNATDFGDLTQIVASPASMTDSIRGLFAGGYTPSPSFSRFNSIDFINIATTGNASDFGDLTYAQNYGGGCSDSHGGLS